MTAAGLIIIAALPREVHGLVGKARPDPELRASGIQLYDLPNAVVVTAGMGASRAALALAAALKVRSAGEVVSIGLAGGCNPHLQAGEAREAGLVVDERTGERFATAASESGCVLVSTDAIAGVGEKARLAAAYGADMVDMEAATLARLAQARGLRFRAIKGISDAADFELASLRRFSTTQGEFRTAAFALHTALRPRTWSHAAALGRNSNRALVALHERVRALMARSRGEALASNPQ